MTSPISRRGMFMTAAGALFGAMAGKAMAAIERLRGKQPPGSFGVIGQPVPGAVGAPGRYDYDELARDAYVADEPAASDPVEAPTIAYTYDEQGRLLSVTDSSQPRCDTFVY